MWVTNQGCCLQLKKGFLGWNSILKWSDNSVFNSCGPWDYIRSKIFYHWNSGAEDARNSWIFGVLQCNTGKMASCNFTLSVMFLLMLICSSLTFCVFLYTNSDIFWVHLTCLKSDLYAVSAVYYDWLKNSTKTYFLRLSLTKFLLYF